jgi:hypothetical protein
MLSVSKNALGTSYDLKLTKKKKRIGRLRLIALLHTSHSESYCKPASLSPNFLKSVYSS